MIETKFFKICGNKIFEVPSITVGLERSIQNIIESNLETILGVKFIRSEYATGKSHKGRIDTLGLDENGSPVIIEYKRTVNENVINQGLYYLDWLLDHKAEFKLIIMESLGNKNADKIDWTGPRLICIATNFTKYDEHAVKQINRNIDLVRYRRFGADLIALELIYWTSAAEPPQSDEQEGTKQKKKHQDKSFQQWLKEIDKPTNDIYESLRAYILALGDDVQEKQLKFYMAYRKIKNFACVVIAKERLIVYLKLNPDIISMKEGFIRDVRKIGHWATGDVEVTLKNMDLLREVEPLILRAYEEA